MIAPTLAALLATLLDGGATAAQRNDACYALRGQRAPEAIAALAAAIGDKVVRVCAARDLREAGAVDALLSALASADADTQMAAARELGELRDSRALEPLGLAAVSENPLVGAAAITALGSYPTGDALPYLLNAAGQPGVSGVNALEQAARSKSPEVLKRAREVLATGDVASQVIALSIIGDLGDQRDLPKLRELAARSDPQYSRGRGFGFMPPIDVARAAQTAITRISK
ncbi:MAG: HEAT repeat domain-containing protein [Candidatus Solibacter sp.]